MRPRSKHRNFQGHSRRFTRERHYFLLIEHNASINARRFRSTSGCLRAAFCAKLGATSHLRTAIGAELAACACFLGATLAVLGLYTMLGGLR